MTGELPITTPEVNRGPTAAELHDLGRACLEAAVEPGVLQEHEALIQNPNTVGGFALPLKSGDIATEPDKVYRQVGLEAVQDLVQSGIVRNGATAQGREHERWGHRVFWSQGAKGTHVNTSGRAVLVAPKAATEAGWVRGSDLHAVYAKTGNGELVNLLSQPATPEK